MNSYLKYAIALVLLVGILVIYQRLDDGESSLMHSAKIQANSPPAIQNSASPLRSDDLSSSEEPEERNESVSGIKKWSVLSEFNEVYQEALDGVPRAQLRLSDLLLFDCNFAYEFESKAEFISYRKQIEPDYWTLLVPF